MATIEKLGIWKVVCQDQRCRAIHDTGCTVTAYAHQRTPNSLAYRSLEEAAYFRRVYAGNIHALRRKHPSRIPRYCDILARVAARVIPDTKEDLITDTQLTEMTLRLDRPGNHCVSRVMRTLPANLLLDQYDRPWPYQCHRHWTTCRRTVTLPG